MTKFSIQLCLWSVFRLFNYLHVLCAIFELIGFDAVWEICIHFFCLLDKSNEFEIVILMKWRIQIEQFISRISPPSERHWHYSKGTRFWSYWNGGQMAFLFAFKSLSQHLSEILCLLTLKRWCFACKKKPLPNWLCYKIEWNNKEEKSWPKKVRGQWTRDLFQLEAFCTSLEVRQKRRQDNANISQKHVTCSLRGIRTTEMMHLECHTASKAVESFSIECSLGAKIFKEYSIICARNQRPSTL